MVCYTQNMLETRGTATRDKNKYQNEYQQNIKIQRYTSPGIKSHNNRKSQHPSIYMPHVNYNKL